MNREQEELVQREKFLMLARRGELCALRKVLSQGFLRSVDSDSGVVAVTDNDINKALIEAVRNGKVKACGVLFNSLSEDAKEKCRADETEGDYCPLHVAMCFLRREVACFLLDSCKCNINQLDSTGWTPLYWAVSEHECLELARFLLEQGADPNRCRGSMQHPLYFAITNEKADMVRLLLEYGADPNFYRSPQVRDEDEDENENRYVLSATGAAMMVGNAEILIMLLNHGALMKPNLLGQNFYDYGLWRVCCSTSRLSREKKVSICRTLVQHAASGDRPTTKFLHEALEYFIDIDDAELLGILLESGLVPKRPLMRRFIREGKVAIFQLLVQYGIDPFQDEGDGPGTSLFHYAAKQKTTEVLELFLDHWDKRFASNRGKNNDGDYPIHVLSCIEKVSLQAIQLVIERQGDTLATVDGEEGLYPFHFAAMWGTKLNVLYSLVRRCPDALTWLRHGCPNNKSIDGVTGMSDEEKEEGGPRKKKAKTTR